MFLKLTQWTRPGNTVVPKSKSTWVNFNNVTEMEQRTFKAQNGTEHEYTIIFFNTSQHDDQSSSNVLETPEVICELLKENTTVKVLFGGK